MINIASILPLTGLLVKGTPLESPQHLDFTTIFLI